MNMNAIKSGRILEKLVYDNIKNIKNAKITSQYKYKDIFDAKARMDFLVERECNKFFIECKNQNVPGSLDQKFPYYIENIRQNRYEGNRLIFVLNTNGIRKKVLDYLINNSMKYNYTIVDTYNLDKLNKIIYNLTSELIFLKK